MLLPLLLLACTGADPVGTVAWPVVEPVDTPVAEPRETPVLPDLSGGPAVFLNELQSRNDSTVEDDAGREVDWVELVSLEAEAVDLSGWGLTDDPDQGARWAFPEGTLLQPGEHRVLWLDGLPERGPDHLPFALAGEGETLALLDAGGAVVDAVEVPPLPVDVVYGRFPDGGALWAPSLVATPHNANPLDPGFELDPSTALFPDEEVLVLELWLPPEGFDALAADPYAHTPGSVTFRGVTLPDVGIRIKGQAGSLRTLDGKAALKVDTTQFGGSRTLRGLEKLTLNNMVQDPSLVHERLAYRLMREMGVPAPRTAHVALTLNGVYRGVYLHVESPDERFLAQWFTDPEGNLYEGQYGEDVTLTGYVDLEQDELGTSDPDDRAELLALAELLAQPPSEDLVPAFEALVDVDAWMAALAAEVLIGHWDGYFYYPNNYRLYHDPGTGLLSLLPWGVDQTFASHTDLFAPQGDVAAWALAVPSLEARYRLALWEGTDAWARLDLRGEALATHQRLRPFFTSPYEEHSLATSEAVLGTTVDYVEQRPDEVLEGIELPF